jgi:hypothetical protein
MTKHELKHLRIGAVVYNPITETRHTVTGFFNKNRVQLDNFIVAAKETLEILVPDYIDSDLKQIAKSNGGSAKRHGHIAKFKS